ncbi:MAG: PAS domain S-box protein [Alphaproteobacteria bacterium]|nr:PAS domain S-box protein [Alphaproteobacteria bacterium]
MTDRSKSGAAPRMDAGDLCGVCAASACCCGDPRHAPVRALPADFFHAVVEAQTEAVIAIDQRGIVQYLSHGAERLFGFARTEVVGRNVSMLMPPEEARAHDAHVARAVRSGEDRIIGRTREVTGLTADGRRLPLDLRVVRLAIAGGPMFLGTLRDVSDRKAREAALATMAQELRERNVRLDATLGSIAEGVCLYDAEQRLVSFNRRYVELLGLPGEAIQPGMKLQSVLELSASFGSFDADETGDAIENRVAMARARQPGVLICRLAGGRTLRIAHNPAPDGRGVETIMDVTDMEQTAQALQAAVAHAEAANRAKSEFLANMSHELRTPLNAVLGLSEALTLGILGPLNARQGEYLHDIHDAGTHLLQIINDLLDLAKIEAGRYQLDFAHCDPVVLAEDALRIAAPLAEAAGIGLIRQYAPALLPAAVDARAVRQILINLLSNAIKFTPRGGLVTVTIDGAAAGGVRFAITDTGIGMSEAELAIAIRPFGQVQTAYTRRQSGTGLGLPLSRLLAELHGGRLAIASRPAEGTTVTVELPAGPDQRDAEGGAAEPGRAARA